MPIKNGVAIELWSEARFSYFDVMVSHLYRIRKARDLLDGFHELEAQQIYFAESGELNDPVEGFKDLVWLGDEIVWRNLLKHYILTLLNIVPLCFGGEPDGGSAHLQNIVFVTPDDLPNAPIRAIYERVTTDFLADPAVGRFIELMAIRTAPIRRGELTSYLRSLHPFALDATFREFSQRGVLTVPNFTSSEKLGELRVNAMKMMEGAARLPSMESATEKAAESFFLANEVLVAQLQLVNEYQVNDRAAARALAFFCHYFPAAYVGSLGKLVHRDWYAACFSANPINASMWGTYGDGHRGVCLKFRTTPNTVGAPSLRLKRITGLGGTKEHSVYSWDFVAHEFRKVTYQPAFPAIDFFRSLGNIAQIKLNHFWYRGDGGGHSTCRDTAFVDQAARDAYWRTLDESALFKTAEWAHEEEYRLLLHSGFDLREGSTRKLEYKFEDLTGVIFGARTELEDKLRIIRIIDQKCAKVGRNDFEFLEMRYAPASGSFLLSPLSLLKLNYS